MIRLVDRERIDLTVVGPEAPLGNGLADRFEAEGRRVFGPTKGAAQLETSKAFAKDFMQRHGVPTARYRVCTSAADALSAIRSGEFGDALVVKADGLAAGKGVVVAPDRATAEAAVEAAMIDKSFGDAGSRVVLEELLTGPEVSFFVVANGEHYVPLLSAQDHKRIFDDDQGPNTGGMGAFSPSPLMNDALQSQIEKTIVQPVLEGHGGRRKSVPWISLLRLDADARRPEGDRIQRALWRSGSAGRVAAARIAVGAPSLESDGFSRRRASADAKAPLSRRVAVGVVLAAHGYPGEVRTGDVIHGLDDVARDCPDVQLFFAGVKQKGNDLVTSGGRVLTVMATAPSYQIAIARAYEAASKIQFDGMQYRRHGTSATQ